MAQLPNAVNLLAPEEPPAFEWLNRSGQSPVLLLCDHAANRVPKALHNLGLSAAQLSTHIAWDPGAAKVARALSTHLDAPLILSNYSRLVIDCNRPLGSPESIPASSAGVAILGNQGLTPAHRQARIDEFFFPYHQAIAALLDERHARPTVLLSIHSFTPVLPPAAPRPWHVGVSFRTDARLADALYAALTDDPVLCVGYNQPYDIDDQFDYAIPVHGEGRALPCAMIELRQDGVQDRALAETWALRLARAYQSIAAQFAEPQQAK